MSRTDSRGCFCMVFVRESTTAALSLLEWRVGTRPQHQKSNWSTQDRGS
ncbi:hypothetical protein BDA96_05G171500 [Sorghum bicolor]|uniref:Uncharacterized protein n=1 Tax=Sorghum bicolor TaxID=4558 RepID=A0A921QZT4_SORBI|nr:hypothetical protein BDA96_05G171500 [Sorghum bicolor]